MSGAVEQTGKKKEKEENEKWEGKGPRSVLQTVVSLNMRMGDPGLLTWMKRLDDGEVFRLGKVTLMRGRPISLELQFTWLSLVVPARRK
ncbi:hypothetical protein CDAR_560831 [Caerostris darwini]|uniref:Uncharacterized protein n=1 Tax=Caerostris darwini TaxID=1538125 RepID=A0AAV4U032_9ARAC|nr:hypothetical protein CDAR_560831 [Caerostris darwini]